MLEVAIVISIFCLIQFLLMKGLLRPFNRHGIDNKIFNPHRKNKFLKKCCKDVNICQFDIVNVTEAVIKIFEGFCEKYGDNFIAQNIQSNPDENFDDELKMNQFEIYSRICELAEFLEIRKLNESTIKHLRELIYSRSKLNFVQSGENEFSKTEVFSKCGLTGKIWFDGKLLKHDLVITDNLKSELFNLLKVEDELKRNDREFAKEILTYSAYLWD